MPKQKRKYTMSESIQTLKGFPKAMARNPKLLPELERRFNFDRDVSPSQLLSDWENQSNLDKFYLIGWLKSGIDAMGVSTMLCIGFVLNQKTLFNDCVDAILANSNAEEKKSYEKGFRANATKKMEETFKKAQNAEARFKVNLGE